MEEEHVRGEGEAEVCAEVDEEDISRGEPEHGLEGET